MTTPRCDICGDFESENTTIEVGYGACQDCLTRLVENEVEKRASQSESFRSQSGDSVLANVHAIAQAVK